ncbi:MAG TPA: hypothetical protein VGM32_24640 [Rhodopila sp.]|jgi:hypothetical protein
MSKSTDPLQDKILTLLAPLFLAATGGDTAAAREVARSTLVTYHPRGDDELRLAALTMAFGFGALDALSNAAGPGVSLNQAVRLRSSACALSRASHYAQAALDRMHKQGTNEPAPRPEPAVELPISAEPDDLLKFARSVMEADTAPAVPLSRLQRRRALRGGRGSIH